MSGPRRHGSRRSAAACAFVLLVLAFALVRGSVASANGTATPHRHHKHTAAGGLLAGVGKVVTKVGHTVDGVLSDVGSVLGHNPQARPTTTPRPTPTPTSRVPSPPASSTPVPTKPATHPNPRPSSPAATSAPAPGTSHSSGSVVHSVQQPSSHAASSGSRVATTSPVPAAPSPARTTHAVTALDSPSAGIPGLDITASLAALMIAMVLGVGLIVHRAGYRGQRTG
jgi:hypothetical protein